MPPFGCGERPVNTCVATEGRWWCGLARQPYSPRSVTAPSEAEDTSFAYFASVPRVA